MKMQHHNLRLLSAHRTAAMKYAGTTTSSSFDKEMLLKDRVPCSSHLCPFYSLTGLSWWCLIKESNNHMQRPSGEGITVSARDHVCMCVSPTGSDNLWFMESVTTEDNEAHDEIHTLSALILNLVPATVQFAWVKSFLLCFSHICSTANFLLFSLPFSPSLFHLCLLCQFSRPCV